MIEKTIKKLRAENLAFTTLEDWNDFVVLRDAKTIGILVDMFIKSHITKIL